MFNFLALLDIRVFGRLYLWLLIGFALFLQPGCFCLARYHMYARRIINQPWTHAHCQAPQGTLLFL